VEEPTHTREGAFRKAEAILRIKPQAVLFEFPRETGFSLGEFNTFPPQNKPGEWVDSLKKSYRKDSEKYPWLETEHLVIEAIERLWEEGRQVYLFEIDAPLELTSQIESDALLREELNVAWNFLRELYMFETIKEIEKQIGEDGEALVICSDFHWNNIMFLMADPSRDEIWRHYFGSATMEEVQNRVRSNKVLAKHWTLKARFPSGRT